MNLSDYEVIWKRQELPRGASADVGQLKVSFSAKSRKMYATLLARDLLEAVVGVVVCLGLAFIWRKLGSDGWPLGVSMVLVLGVSGVFVRERFRARRLPLSPDVTLLAKVEADLAELQHQCHLSRWMWAWYLGPVFVAILLGHTAFYLHSEPWEPLRDPRVSAGFLAFYLVLFGLAWTDIRNGLRRRLEPRLAELKKLRRELLAED